MTLTPDGLKACPRCGEPKLAAGNFYKTGRATGDGYSGYCIPCTKAAAIGWQKALPADRRHAKNKADWERRKHPTAAEQAKRTAAQKRWADANREHVRENHRQWSAAYKAREPERYRQHNAIHSNFARARRLGLPNAFQWIDWVQVLEAFSHCCAFCGATECLLDIEHMVPLSKGGPNIVGNVVPACRPCNAQKYGRSLEEFARLRGLTEADLDRIRTMAAL